MKRPSFQFYPSDWLRDTALRTCSIGSRGLWIDMLCFMHEGNPYGHLKVGNKVILPVNLASMVGATLVDVEGWLEELRLAGVYDLDADGTIISRRMIRDENLRNMRAAGGKLGGNPALKVAGKVNLKDKQKPTPSSSSSSSSSTSLIKEPIGSLRATKKCPSSFQVTEELQAWALSECPQVDLKVETDKLMDHEFKTARKDWPGTWRNWMRKAQQDAIQRQQGDGTAYTRHMDQRASELAPGVARMKNQQSVILENFDVPIIASR